MNPIKNLANQKVLKYRIQQIQLIILQMEYVSSF